MIKKQTFYDSDCLSSFLIINEGNLLKELFHEINIPSQVYEELTCEGTPENVKNNLQELIMDNFVKIVDLYAETAEYLNYRNIINGNLYKGCRIGKGEAAAITLAYENKGILASNNFKDIKFYVDYFELPLLTTAYLLGILFDKNIINKDEANSMWNKMIKYRRALPESSFEIYYNNLYKKDYDDFGKRIEF